MTPASFAFPFSLSTPNRYESSLKPVQQQLREEESSDTELDSVQAVTKLGGHTEKTDQSLVAELEAARAQKAEFEKKLAFQSGIPKKKEKTANVFCNTSAHRQFEYGQRACICAFRQNKSGKSDLFNGSRHNR